MKFQTIPKNVFIKLKQFESWSKAFFRRNCVIYLWSFRSFICDHCDHLFQKVIMMDESGKAYKCVISLLFSLLFSIWTWSKLFSRIIPISAGKFRRFRLTTNNFAYFSSLMMSSQNFIRLSYWQRLSRMATGRLIFR